MRIWQIIIVLCGAAALAGTFNIIEGKRIAGDWAFTLIAFALAGYAFYKLKQKKREQEEKDHYWD